jgi:hypothetical protein
MAGAGVVVWRGVALGALWRAPRFHGRSWFFDTQVGDGFYEGRGREIVREYHRAIALPHLVELPGFALACVWLRAWPIPILSLIAVMAMLVSWYQTRVAKRFAVRAWDFESPRTPAESRVAVPLMPQREREHRHPAVDAALGIAAAISLGLLAWVHFKSGPETNRFALWALPLAALYLALGLRLVRAAIVDARITRIPANNAAKYLAWREQVRKFWLTTCDWITGYPVLFALLYAVNGALPDAVLAHGRQARMVMVTCVAYTIPMVVSMMRGQRLLVELTRTLKGRPRMTPAAPQPAESKWRAIAASPRIFAVTAYLGGLAALAVWIGVRV